MSRAPWTALHAQLHQTLRLRSLLPKRQRLLVAVSGGQDSLCLMQLLRDLQPKWEWDLGIAHCNHRWRKDASANADHVAQLAYHWNLPYYLLTATVIPTSEADARSWRYQVLVDTALQQGYPYVVTGHTASDRAETLLYNLIRGSGSDGLQALTWQRQFLGIDIVRPLLEVTRSQTAQFCQDAHLQVWEDSTNFDLQYARNRIRQELIPYLAAHFNAQITPTLAQTAEILRAEVEFLEAAAVELCHQIVEPQIVDSSFLPVPTVAKSWQLDRLRLNQAPLALQRRVIRQVLQAALPSAPCFEHIEKMLTLTTASNHSQTDPFPGGWVAQVEGQWIHLYQP